MKNLLNSYAHLLVNYCLELTPGDKALVRSTTLAEPLLRELYREALRAGAIMEFDIHFQGQDKLLLEEGTAPQLNHLPILFEKAVQHFDAYLLIRAPFNTAESANVPEGKSTLRQLALKDLYQLYSQRTADRSLRRSLCEYPVNAHAQQAGLSLEDYQQFVFGACKLFQDDPIAAWKEVGQEQQRIVDHLNKCKQIHYKGEHIDLTFKTEGRQWINSDGRTNMPSGEVYTSPVEDSVNGHVHFSFPGHYMGRTVEGITLWVKDGLIELWEARQGKDFLDYIFSLEGTRHFGEAAIGTNYNITQQTSNILFDEKMGGTVHLAIGQSYLQAGGKNQSPVHWDMITDMSRQGAIFADGNKIYEDGSFLI